MLLNPFRKKPLNSGQEKILLEAIRLAELKTSGEIRVHFDNRKIDDAYLRAVQVFTELKMHETKDRNGILFYLNLKDRKFAICGDKGIHEKVSDSFWDEVRDATLTQLSRGNIIEALKDGIVMCGEKLKVYFPIQADDKNELSNEISY